MRLETSKSPSGFLEAKDTVEEGPGPALEVDDLATEGVEGLHDASHILRGRHLYEGTSQLHSKTGPCQQAGQLELVRGQGVDADDGDDGGDGKGTALVHG